MSKLLSNSIEDGAVSLSTVKQFHAMLTASGPSCFADATLKVRNEGSMCDTVDNVPPCLYYFFKHHG